MSESDYSAFPMDQTLCKNCKYKFSRMLIPLNYEDWGINPEEFIEADNDTIIIEQHVCLITNQPLEEIVTECNRYIKDDEETFFIGNPYKR